MIGHHDDNSMDVMDIRWEWTGTYWVRDEHHEALKALREAGMLAVITEEELPAGISPLASNQVEG